MPQPSSRQLQALEALINQALKLDPLAQERLTKLEGNAIRIQCTEPDIDAIISINVTAITLASSTDQTTDNVDCHLTGDMSAFPV